jgi:hypothetical protein
MRFKGFKGAFKCQAKITLLILTKSINPNHCEIQALAVGIVTTEMANSNVHMV